jgi:hypothetical protein
MNGLLLQRKPHGEFIVFRIGVAQQQGIPCWCAPPVSHASSLVLTDAALQGWQFALMAA